MKNVQWKYQNNGVSEAGYIRGEVTQDDCLGAGEQFFIATIPEGVIVKSITVYPTGELDTANEHNVIIDIGINDCVFCKGNVTDLNAGVACVQDCSCKMTDQAYLVRLTLEQAIEVGGVMVLVEVINPNILDECAVEPIEIKTKSVMIEPCTPEADNCSKGCPEDVPPPQDVPPLKV